MSPYEDQESAEMRRLKRITSNREMQLRSLPTTGPASIVPMQLRAQDSEQSRVEQSGVKRSSVAPVVRFASAPGSVESVPASESVSEDQVRDTMPRSEAASAGEIAEVWAQPDAQESSDHVSDMSVVSDDASDASDAAGLQPPVLQI